MNSFAIDKNHILNYSPPKLKSNFTGQNLMEFYKPMSDIRPESPAQKTENFQCVGESLQPDKCISIFAQKEHNGMLLLTFTYPNQEKGIKVGIMQNHN